MKSTLNILAKIVRRADIARAIQSYIYNLAENVAAIRQKVLTGYPHNIKLNKYFFIDFFAQTLTKNLLAHFFNGK